MQFKRHIPNSLSALRIALTPVLVFGILESISALTLSVFVVILLSDFADGAVARALSVCSKSGAVFDVIADLIYIISALVALNAIGTAPVWFTVIVLVKFIEFAVTSAWSKRRQAAMDTWVFDHVGRAFALLVMLAPGVLCLGAYLSIATRFIIFLLVGVCTLGMVSSFSRVTKCIKTVKKQTSPKALWVPASE